MDDLTLIQVLQYEWHLIQLNLKSISLKYLFI